MKLSKLKEQWMPTSIQASFLTPSLRSLPDEDSVILDLPLINLGWTFSLMLTRQRVARMKELKHRPWAVRGKTSSDRWRLSTLAFHGQDSTIPWGNTSMTAELHYRYNLGCDLCYPRFPERSSTPCPQCNRTETSSTPLGTLTIGLANTHSAEIPLQPDCLVPGTRYEVGLIVTISECPFADGLYQAGSDYLHHAKPPPQTKRQSNDNILCRSLRTGNVSDVTFLTFGTHCTLALVDKPIPIYAPLSILEQQIDIPSGKLQEEWRSALSVAGDCGNSTGKSTYEIVCPPGYEYDLDSDYEDEDEDVTSSILPSPPNKGSDGASSEGGETKRSSSSVIVIESAEDITEDSTDYNRTDISKASEAQRSSSPMAAPDCERTITVKFAAHKTWHAFLWYCYTGYIRFGKLRSLGIPKKQIEQLQDEPPACSPKSMYRLAHMFGNEALRSKALEAIQENLTETNTVEEAFSEFSSKYPEVQDVQLCALIEHCHSTDVKKAYLNMILKSKIMPHAEPMLSAFYDKLAE